MEDLFSKIGCSALDIIASEIQTLKQKMFPENCVKDLNLYYFLEPYPYKEVISQGVYFRNKETLNIFNSDTDEKVGIVAITAIVTVKDQSVYIKQYQDFFITTDDKKLSQIMAIFATKATSITDTLPYNSTHVNKFNETAGDAIQRSGKITLTVPSKSTDESKVKISVRIQFDE